MTMAGGSTVNVGAAGAANVGGNAGTSGTLTVGGGSSITANVFGIGGNSDTTAGGSGSAVVTGAGSALNASGRERLCRGRPQRHRLARSDEPGRDQRDHRQRRSRPQAAFGTLTVDNAYTQPLGSADRRLAGRRSLCGRPARRHRRGDDRQRQRRHDLEPRRGGGRPERRRHAGLSAGGTGVLTVSNSQVNLDGGARPGDGAHRPRRERHRHLHRQHPERRQSDGAAADGSLIVAGQAGSTGTLALNAGSVVKAGYVGVGATTGGAGRGGDADAQQQQPLHHDPRDRRHRTADRRRRRDQRVRRRDRRRHDQPGQFARPGDDQLQPHHAAGQPADARGPRQRRQLQLRPAAHRQRLDLRPERRAASSSTSWATPIRTRSRLPAGSTSTTSSSRSTSRPARSPACRACSRRARRGAT